MTKSYLSTSLNPDMKNYDIEELWLYLKLTIKTLMVGAIYAKADI